MAFDQPTRNRLARFVSDARTHLTEEFTRQLQNDYGLNPTRGEVAPLASLTHLDNAQRETAQLLRQTLEHYLATSPSQGAKAKQEVLDRIVREQAFTVLNRLCALRMAEARGLLVESIARGYQSRGFQLYARLAGSALGETGDAYRAYLFSLFDEFAVDLAVLFDRFSPQGRLFPRESALLALLEEINHPDLEPLWAEDETIGWVYQYFNSVDERRQMRAASQAPRNSRELAVRNQFFTPRYVVEFLTDNTLGRIWYEMMRGETRLVDQCRYLVRRPVEIFLGTLDLGRADFADWVQAALGGDFSQLPETPHLDEIGQLALLIDGYELQDAHAEGDVLAFGSRHMQAFVEQDVAFPNDALSLWLTLFAYQRGMLRQGLRDDPNNPHVRGIRAAYTALRHALQNPPDDLSQEELLRQPVFIPRREPKDPRTLKMLDPACGSMHFGLYAFDLFATIYEEAWEKGMINTREFGDGDEAYANFRHAIPQMIIERNIHGIDIDPRAVQIAGLSLWLRAQRAWHDQGVKATERRIITRSNIVCAEPMPGDKAQLEEFLKQLRDQRLQSLIARVINVQPGQTVRATPTMADALCDLVRTIWEEMELAGEAGSLLKIEEALTDAIAKGRAEWEDKMPLFRVETFRMTEERAVEKPKVNYMKVLPGEDVDFWDRAEALVLAALEEYASQAQNGQSYARRLFAEDAARGFAFIDLCRKRYDVVLMNPPFGELSSSSFSYLSQMYSDSKNDILQAFVARSQELLNPHSYTGAITSRNPLFLYQSQGWRERVLLSSLQPTVVADLGGGVLEAAVETAAYVLRRLTPYDKKSVFLKDQIFCIRLIEDEDKGHCLLEAIKDGNDARRFYVTVEDLKKIPGSPLAYWVSNKVRRLFSEIPSFEHNERTAKQGLATADDFRFCRLWWEPISQNVMNWQGADQADSYKWFVFTKGDSVSLFMPDLSIYVNYKDEGIELRNFSTPQGKPRAFLRNTQYYFRPGLTFSSRARQFAPKLVPKGTVFSHTGLMLFASPKDLAWIATLMGSDIERSLLGLMAPPRKNELGYVAKLPVPQEIEPAIARQLTLAQQNGYQRGQLASMGSEVMLYFCCPHVFLNSKAAIATIPQGKINDLVCQALGINEVDGENLLRELAAVTGLAAYRQQSDDASSTDDLEANEIESGESISPQDKQRDIVSYFLGTSFGRWDIRYASGERQPPPLPDPIAPLPVCPPGMLQNDVGLPASPGDVSDDYPLRISWPGILVDDPGHPEDIEVRVREALQVIWGARAEAIEQEACTILGVRALRDYLAGPNNFFADHLSRYSKSRRAAPIYWPLSTTSGAYTLWLYYHRLTDQTLYQAVNDFVEPKRKEVAEHLSALQRKPGRSRDDERELERLATLDQELADFSAELLRVAAFWKPNLNDGVQITAAPLWRLFNHRAWSKKLKDTWEKLEDGDYDWAHLAYSIWPDRVREKCRTDKSLAIAHDLEAIYVEPPASKKKAKRGKRKQAMPAEAEQDELFDE